MKQANFSDVAKCYLMPWKLVTFATGLIFLFIGAHLKLAPDWDFCISIIMALLTYLSAPWAARVVVNREWKKIPLALTLYYISVDFSYWLYWTFVDENALFMRPANFLASTCLYWLCGFIWLHNGPIKELLRDELN